MACRTHSSGRNAHLIDKNSCKREYGASLIRSCRRHYFFKGSFFSSSKGVFRYHYLEYFYFDSVDKPVINYHRPFEVMTLC